MAITVVRAPQTESGRRVYHVQGKTSLLAIIRYFDASVLRDTGRRDLPPHWALLKVSGRTERFETFAETRDEALKLDDPATALAA